MCSILYCSVIFFSACCVGKCRALEGGQKVRLFLIFVPKNAWLYVVARRNVLRGEPVPEFGSQQPPSHNKSKYTDMSADNLNFVTDKLQISQAATCQADK